MKEVSPTGGAASAHPRRPPRIPCRMGEGRPSSKVLSQDVLGTSAHHTAVEWAALHGLEFKAQGGDLKRSTGPAEGLDRFSQGLRRHRSTLYRLTPSFTGSNLTIDWAEWLSRFKMLLITLDPSFPVFLLLGSKLPAKNKTRGFVNLGPAPFPKTSP